MARTTGYTASATVDILAQNIFSEKGVFPPEMVGSKSKVVDYLMNHLISPKKNNLRVNISQIFF